MVKNVPDTAGPHITLLHSTLLCYNVGDMPQKLNPCFYRLDYGLFHYTMFHWKSQNLSMTLSEDLLYSERHKPTDSRPE